MKSKCCLYLSVCAAAARARCNINAAVFGVTKKRKKKTHGLDESFGNLGNLKVVIGGPPTEDHWCKWLLNYQLCELHEINTANVSSVKT